MFSNKYDFSSPSYLFKFGKRGPKGPAEMNRSCGIADNIISEELPDDASNFFPIIDNILFLK